MSQAVSVAGSTNALRAVSSALEVGQPRRRPGRPAGLHRPVLDVGGERSATRKQGTPIPHSHPLTWRARSHGLALAKVAFGGPTFNSNLDFVRNPLYVAHPPGSSPCWSSSACRWCCWG